MSIELKSHNPKVINGPLGPVSVHTTESYDNVNHPLHYVNHPSGIECIQITRHMNFNLGNAIKYIWRADMKGNKIQDLKKAVFYLNDEINKEEQKYASPNK